MHDDTIRSLRNAAAFLAGFMLILTWALASGGAA